MSRIAFSPMSDGNFVLLRPALEAARLPIDDLDQPGRIFFELSDAAGPIGFIGLEGDGADRLLRSLVVLPGRKRQGYGGLLVAHAEAFARRDGVRRLHLLTTTATDFFRAHGYRSAERAHAPAAIAATAQFTSLCPGNAVYLLKDLA
jgi:N-acetylglutamate synthase-like GNAT family acetyltransferase